MHAKWPRALQLVIFWGTSWVGSSVKVVTGRVEGTGSGNIILPCSLRRDPHQLGSAEETTDAHFEEKSLHPCTQDARWRLSSSHACFFPHASLAPSAPASTALFSPWLHKGRDPWVVKDARQNSSPEIASDDARVFGPTTNSAPPRSACRRRQIRVCVCTTETWARVGRWPVTSNGPGRRHE
jgi:hypothetical protein